MPKKTIKNLLGKLSRKGAGPMESRAKKRKRKGSTPQARAVKHPKRNSSSKTRGYKRAVHKTKKKPYSNAKKGMGGKRYAGISRKRKLKTAPKSTKYLKIKRAPRKYGKQKRSAKRRAAQSKQMLTKDLLALRRIEAELNEKIKPIRLRNAEKNMGAMQKHEGAAMDGHGKEAPHGTNELKKRVISEMNAKKLFIDLPEEHKFWLASGGKIGNLNELRKELKVMSDKTFYHHVNDSKNDFARWVWEAYSDRELARLIEPIKNRRDMIFAIEQWIDYVTYENVYTYDVEVPDSTNMKEDGSAYKEKRRTEELKEIERKFEDDMLRDAQEIREDKGQKYLQTDVSQAAQGIVGPRNEKPDIKSLIRARKAAAESQKKEQLESGPRYQEAAGAKRPSNLAELLARRKAPGDASAGSGPSSQVSYYDAGQKAREAGHDKALGDMPIQQSLSQARLSMIDMPDASLLLPSQREDAGVREAQEKSRQYILKGKKIEPDRNFLVKIRSDLSTDPTTAAKNMENEIVRRAEARSAYLRDSSMTGTTGKPELDKGTHDAIYSTISRLSDEIGSLKELVSNYDERIDESLAVHQREQHELLIKEEQKRRAKILAKMKELEDDERDLRIKKARIRALEDEIRRKEEEISGHEEEMKKKKKVLEEALVGNLLGSPRSREEEQKKIELARGDVLDLEIKHLKAHYSRKKFESAKKSVDKIKEILMDESLSMEFRYRYYEILFQIMSEGNMKK